MIKKITFFLDKNEHVKKSLKYYLQKGIPKIYLEYQKINQKSCHLLSTIYKKNKNTNLYYL